MADTAWKTLWSYFWPACNWLIYALRWFTFYSPQTGLIFLYPNLAYLAIISRRHSDSLSGRRHGLRANDTVAWVNSTIPSSFWDVSIYVIILLPPCYLFLQQYSLLVFQSQRSGAQHLACPPDVELQEMLQTSLDMGLAEEEVMRRRNRYGWNEVETGRDWVYLFQRMMIWPDGAGNINFEVGCILSLYLGDWAISVLISALLMLEVGVYVYQVKNADDVTDQIAVHSIKANVLRDGQRKSIPARELVHGDIVYLDEGSAIPADCRIVSEHGQLASDQSTITGESKPVAKARGDVCYYSCGVKSGYALALVETMAPHSFVGRTAKLIAEGSPPRKRGQTKDFEPRLQWDLDHLKVKQSIGAIIVSLIIIFVAMLIALSEGSYKSPSTLELCVALVIAALPTGLNIKITTIRATGAGLLSKHGAVAQSLPRVESLAGVDSLCIDKTGTLTQNILQVMTPYCCNGDIENLIRTAGLASEILSLSEDERLDPIDEACARALKKYHVSLGGYNVVNFIPFNPDSKLIESEVTSPTGERIKCVKGAPRAVMELCGRGVDEYIQHAQQFARAGSRALGIARQSDGKDWELLGLLPMHDPPRKSTAASIDLAKGLGVAVKMLTGDAVIIARDTARRVGLPNDSCVLAEDVFSDATNELQRTRACENASVFAEIFSEHKELIVRALQEAGHLVGMSGDGKNDVPALQKADVGIAVAGASETAQCAADYVFLKGGTAVILNAIQTCRQMFELLHSLSLYRSVLSLYLLSVVVWSYAAYDLVFDPMLLLLILNSVELADLSSSFGQEGDVRFSKQPVRWTARSFCGITLSVAFALCTGTLVSLQTCPALDGSSVMHSSIRQQIVFLQSVLLSSPLHLLILTNGRFWQCPRKWLTMGKVLLPGILATASCAYGLTTNGHPMDRIIIRVVWSCSLGTLCVIAGYFALTSTEKCDRVVCGIEEDTEDVQ